MQLNGQRKQLEGYVVSNKMEKTIVVNVEKLIRHPLYSKIVRRSKKYLAHDHENKCAIGDRVLLEETRPLSKRKCWRLVSILEKAVEKG